MRQLTSRWSVHSGASTDRAGIDTTCQDESSWCGPHL